MRAMKSTRIPLSLTPGKATPNSVKSAAPGCGFQTPATATVPNPGTTIDGTATVAKFESSSIVASPQEHFNGNN
jgi:hypothetical protein